MIVVTIFLIVEIPMAIYLIVSGILRLFESTFLGVFLNFAVQLLNFAVLLSYPINFFIYCRMSRAFRDAFTTLLCPTFIEARQQRLQSMAAPLLGKQPTTIVNQDQIELNHTIVPTTKLDPTVILAKNSDELPMTSLSTRTSDDDQRNTSGLRVSFDKNFNNTNS